MLSQIKPDSTSIEPIYAYTAEEIQTHQYTIDC